MKALNSKLKFIPWLLSLVLLFQNCTVYRSTPITLDRAIRSESKTKVNFQNGHSIKFLKIDFENGIYYGIKKNNGRIERLPLDEKYISTIKEKNKTLSTIITVGVLSAYVVLVIIGSSGGFGLQ